MSESEFSLPDVGEGLTEAEIVQWKVAAGDSIELNQVLVEIETAKSLVELPSPFEGTIGRILVDEGTTIDVGTPIVTVEKSGADAAPEPVREAEAVAADTKSTIEPEESGEGSVLVGYGTGGGAASRRRARKRPHTPPRPPASVPAASAGPIIAKPPIRKLAKDLDVDLSAVEGTGLAGEITRDDVVRHAGQASVFRNIETPDWSEDREERVPVKGVRKQIAQAMVSSKFQAPHVSVFVDVDATRTMEFVKRLKASPDFAGVKVSPLLIMARAMVWAVRRNPSVNATWTDEEIIIHHYVNLGIAAATPRGLLVPNVKEAQSMSLLELATALEQLTLTARDGKTQPAEMQNGTITLTNIGVFGMDTGTPILNPGEVGIVAMGTIKQKPWVVDGEVRPRFVTTIGGSFDHRVVDGDVVSRFVADVASIIEEPALLLD
ncbi:dihydrolipoamide acetyltransferase family protein [Microbacterium sp. MPKO10]|uniref:dihydrolipoamide acetyltransferase family protein n=1 Tax=Microbacterium sp. MPKO10 TaxID=2989818 RepID=UPI0022354E7C|nr:dihydrolipoamide acetyltransferase family protein [Microbacterium sp. MPKO10]MCW4459106.1 2-oxo acid dehydrogenase subunit E2 [Microbacterium sp. MPKO10]